MQLIQQNVQKSMMANRARRSASRNGRATLSQSNPCGKSGAGEVPAYDRTTIRPWYGPPLVSAKQTLQLH